MLALLAVTDRVGAALAGRALAAELQRSAALPERPDVTIGGFPFLTQAVRGRYREIAVSAPRLSTEEVTLRQLEARLTGAQVPLTDALSGSVAQVPVERIEATVLLSYEDLARRAGDREVTVSPAPEGDRVRVRGSVQLLGQELSAVAVSRVTLEDGEVVVTAESYEVGNRVADGILTRVLRDRLDFRFRLDGLPYALQVDAVQVQPEGVRVETTATDTVISAR